MSTNRLGSRLHSKTSGQTGKHTYQKKNIANPYSNTRLAKALDPRTGPWWMPGSASARRAPSHPAPRKWEVIMVLWMDEVLATKKPRFSCKHQQWFVLVSSWCRSGWLPLKEPWAGCPQRRGGLPAAFPCKRPSLRSQLKEGTPKEAKCCPT